MPWKLAVQTVAGRKLLSPIPGTCSEFARQLKTLLLTSPYMTSTEALTLFRQTGALLEGHFVLRSGLHSRQFFQCAQALQQMPIVERFGSALAERVRSWGATC